MIIKNKPFRIPACQAMLCWYYASPAVFGLAIPSPSGCEVDLVRRWPGFVKLEAYKARLSRLLAKRWGYVRGERELKRINGSFAIFPEWDGDFYDDDGLIHAGGVL